MSRDIDQNFIDKLKSHYQWCNLIRFTDGSNWYNFNNSDREIYHDPGDGEEYHFMPLNFYIGNINFSLGTVSNSTNIVIEQVEQLLSGVFLGNQMYDQSFKIYLLLWDDRYTILGSQVLFSGFINEFRVNEEQLDITITSYFTKWQQNAYSTQTGLCRWKKFKGSKCQYSGSQTTCDRKYSTCKLYGNQAQFGGHRFLPALENKNFQWGPTY